jgi:uncharacterized protein YdeI (YjbR/CyaY-like superfamily)
MAAAKKASVSDFLKNLDHPFKHEIERLREIILQSNTQLTEQIKWNAPSFCFNGDDRITFRIHPTKLQLIFHRGAKVKSDAKDFLFSDPWGMIEWAAKDRGVISFENIKEIDAREKDLMLLVNKWLEATRD